MERSDPPTSEWIAPRVALVDEPAMTAARERQRVLTKPEGSLGRLEEMAVRIAGIHGFPPRPLARRVVAVFAADHGVALEGVSAYPQPVTAQMVANIANGGAAISVLARAAGARLIVVDAGVANPIPKSMSYTSAPIAPGTKSFTQGPAMTRSQAVRSLETGARVAREQTALGMDVIAVGEMGIGNTTSSSAVTAALVGVPGRSVTGRGTGITDEAWERKAKLVEAALDRHGPDVRDPIGVLSKVGGFEIGAMAGCMLAAAEARVPVVVDGFISTAGALLAAAIDPRVKSYLFASHRSTEPGHRIALQHLGLAPFLDLDMRLGEGSGAVLGMHVLDMSVRLMLDMATFDEAGVAGRSE